MSKKNKHSFKTVQTAPVSEPVVEEANTPSVGEVMEMKSER